MDKLLQQHFGQKMRLYAVQQETILRFLLERWVSELEPVVIYRYHDPLRIVGLGIKGDPTGTIVVAAEFSV